MAFHTYDNVFVAKYDTNGNVVWARKYWASNNDNTSIKDIFYDKAGFIYIAGSFSDSIVFNSDTLKSNDGTNTFIVKCDLNGNVIWVRQSNNLNIKNSCVLSTITIDKAEETFIFAGVFFGSITLAKDTINTSVQALILAKYDKNGNLIWIKTATPYSSYGCQGYSLSSDTLNNLYLSCSGGSYKFDGTTISNVSAYPEQLMKLDTAGNIICWSNVNNCGIGSNEIISDPTGKYVYLLGSFKSIAIFGQDTLLSASLKGNDADPFAARWQSCCSYFGAGSTSICKNNSCILSASGGTSYFWNNGDTTSSITVTPITDTIYQVIINKGTCSLDSNIYIKVNPSPIPNITGRNNICSGISDTIMASGGTIYQWSNGDTVSSIIVNPTSSIIYTVSISNGFCSVADSINIQVIPYPVPAITGKQYICPFQSAEIMASGGSQYLWSTGDTTSTINIAPVSNTSYTVLISNGSCTVSDSSTVFINPLPIPNVCCNTTIFCGQKVQLVSTGGAIYQWATSNGLSCTNCFNPIARPTVTSTYTVTVISDSGCSATDSLTIVVNYRQINVCCDSLITHGESVQLISSGGESYSWSPTTGLNCDTCRNPIAMPNSTTTYTLTVVSDSGCVASRTVTVEVTCGDVFIPNAFSPSEAHNTKLFVRGPCISNMDFMVFDRWGNKVFESQNPDNGWDGTFKGYAMNMGTYVWLLKATLLDGTSIEKKGNVALVR